MLLLSFLLLLLLERRTYKSVLMKKCEGREFEPLLEQLFLDNYVYTWLTE